MSCYNYNIFSILYLFKNFLIKNNKIIYKELRENAQVIILGGSGDAAYRK